MALPRATVMAAPRAWTTRKPMSWRIPWDSGHRTSPKVKTSRPVTKTFFLPRMSAARPMVSSVPVTVSW